MKIDTDVANPTIATSDARNVAQASLEALAKQHNADVQGLLKAAHSAGDTPLPYQIRALNLEARLAKSE